MKGYHSHTELFGCTSSRDSEFAIFAGYGQIARDACGSGWRTGSSWRLGSGRRHNGRCEMAGAVVIGAKVVSAFVGGVVDEYGSWQ